MAMPKITSSTKQRCNWPSKDPLYEKYHDEEWGVPCYDDHKLFEFLVLESAQAGLSWITILRKRDNYRKAFADFDAQKVARFNKRSVERLLGDAGIVRNRLKIEAAISNAKLFLDLQDEHGSFANFLWGYIDGKPIQNKRQTLADYPATTPLSDTISKDMKKRGFRFFGSTICYAHMQAMGMVNDHTVDCFRHSECAVL
ncbi:MAG: DNA-3-methyladenine glycosylase I [Cellvibrionales bacterium]|nr:MAG: DNA-3-methyladenine glycosylase I [Cellvibrionales bacterium]